MRYLYRGWVLKTLTDRWRPVVAVMRHETDQHYWEESSFDDARRLVDELIAEEAI